MGISIFWEDSILRYEYDENWTLADYHYATDLAHDMMAATKHKVDIIVDLSRSKVQPTRLIAAALDANNRILFNQGMVIVIKPTLHVQAAFEFGKRIALENLSFVDKLEEAYALIHPLQPMTA